MGNFLIHAVQNVATPGAKIMKTVCNLDETRKKLNFVNFPFSNKINMAAIYLHLRGTQSE